MYLTAKLAAQGLLSHFGGAFSGAVLDGASGDCKLIPENGSEGSTSLDTCTLMIHLMCV